jgi:DNA-binding transcriptional MerR regulator
LKVYRCRVTGYRISELAERTGFPASTLRYYEQQGLLPAVARTSGGYRSYDERTVERLSFIARAKQLDLPLDEIRDLAAVWDDGACAPVSTGSPA